MIDDSDIETPLTFSSYEDIAQRFRFKTEIDISTTQIEKLIATYSFPEKHPCGKKGCHQPHNNGWLAVTTDKFETLIGSKCGREWGGDSFLLQRTQLNQRQKRATQLALLNDVLRNANKTFDRIHQIKERPRGAIWLDNAIKKLEANCSQELMRMIRLKAHRGESAVETSKLKTEVERELDKINQSGGSSSAYKTEVIGHIVGLETFNFDLREVLMQGIWSKLKAIQKIDVISLPTPALNKLVREVSRFESMFTQAEDILSYGQLFFSTPANFKLIKSLDKQGKHSHLTRINWFD